MAAQILIYGAFMATRPPRQSIQGTPFNSAEFEHGDKVAQINVDPMIMPQAELKANPPREQGRLAGLRIARWLAQIKHPEEKIPIGKDFGAAPRPRRRAPLVFVALCALAAAGVGVAFLYGRGTETTDNAQVEGHLINISSRVGGQVTQVLVQDNQQVKKGDVLLELDRTDLDVRLQSAKAEVASAKAGVQSARAQLALTERNLDAVLEQAQGGVVQASAGLGSSRASIDQAQADIAAARARLSLAQTELTRVQRLRDNSAYAREKIRGAGFTVVESPTAICPIIVHDTAKAIAMSKRLLELGVFVIGFGYPVVPEGHARLRVQISAAHTREHIDRLVDALRKL